jgi:hypothetical protein
MKKLSKKNKDLLATIMGGILAVTTAWLLIDWENFEFHNRHVFVITLSTVNALAGYYTTFKHNENE